MKTIKVYLAGAIFGKSDADCKDWRKTVADALKAIGAEALDPLVRDYRGKESENKETIVTTDLDDIFNSDIVFVKADAPSWGTAMELVYANQMGKFICAWGVPERISPWLEFHTTVQERTFETALAKLIEFVKEEQAKPDEPEIPCGCPTCGCEAATEAEIKTLNA